MLELSVLLGCPASGDPTSCGDSNERVVVIDEFDHLPDPRIESHPVGEVTRFDTLYESWVIPDIEGYPRDSTYPIESAWRIGDGSRLKLQRTLNKRWEDLELLNSDDVESNEGAVRLMSLPTWDNRVTSEQEGGRPVVRGRDCVT